MNQFKPAQIDFEFLNTIDLKWGTCSAFKESVTAPSSVGLGFTLRVSCISSEGNRLFHVSGVTLEILSYFSHISYFCYESLFTE